MTREFLVRLASAASLALLMATPALAGGTTTIHVGLVVTGNSTSPLIGTWRSKGIAGGSPYYLVVGESSGTFYQLVSIPRRGTQCDLRIGGAIHSLERSGSGYEMQYSVRSAEVVASTTNAEACKGVAASYLSKVAAVESLTLSRTRDGRLVDTVAGTEYSRSR